MTQEKIDSIRERMCEECCAFSTLSQLVKDEVCNTCPLNELEASAEQKDWMEQNEGQEVEFRIGGRLFAIREKAQ